MNNQDIHLTFEQLADYVDGRLSISESTEMKAHLAGGCDTCQQEIRWLRETTDIMAQQWESPSRAVRANVQRAFRHYIPASGGQAAARPPVPWFRRLFKSKLRWVTAVVAVIILFLVSGSYYRSWAEEVVLHSATVVELSGTAEIKRAGSKAWEPLNDQGLISAGDKVRTGENGRLGLHFFENNLTYLSPNTELEIIALSIRRDGQERIITLALDAGELYSSGWPPDTNLTRLSIQTPQTVVAVQAQGYDLQINTTLGSEISVINGCAAIVSFDIATQTSYRHETGSACNSQPPVQDAPIAPVFEL